MHNIVNSILFLFIALNLGGLTAHAVNLRRDFYKSIGHTLCESANYPSPSQLWEQGIFDGGIELQTVVPKGQKALRLSQLKKAAYKLAMRYGHRGFAYGICPNMTAWSMSSPAPYSMVKDFESNFLKLKLSTIHSYCRSVRIDYASELGRELRKLFSWREKKQLQDATINIRYLRPGTISVTCRPKDPSKGAELWSLVPIHGFSGSLPYDAKLGDQLETLAEWVNLVRHKNGLYPLVVEKSFLSRSAQRLSSRFGSSHDRRMLKLEKKNLASHNINFLGENRAISTNYAEVAWLFWFSPRHRALIMSDRATHLAVAETRGRGQLQVVLVTASISSNKLPL